MKGFVAGILKSKGAQLKAGTWLSTELEADAPTVRYQPGFQQNPVI